MEVHNLMEDLVFSMVRDAFSEAETGSRTLTCTCYQCQLDVACFVLNRITPAYVLSGRGIIHHDADYKDHLQRKADIVALINRGIKRINEVKRPHFTHANEGKAPSPSGCFFNFPSILGRVFSSTMFEPLSDVRVTLLENGIPVTMISPNWQNPYVTSGTTPGNYVFLPMPVEAKSIGLNTVFEYELVLEKDGYEEFHHFFSIGLVSENRFIEHPTEKSTHRMGDLYIFPATGSRRDVGTDKGDHSSVLRREKG